MAKLVLTFFGKGFYRFINLLFVGFNKQFDEHLGSVFYRVWVVEYVVQFHLSHGRITAFLFQTLTVNTMPLSLRIAPFFYKATAVTPIKPAEKREIWVSRPRTPILMPFPTPIWLIAETRQTVGIAVRSNPSRGHCNPDSYSCNRNRQKIQRMYSIFLL